MTTKSADADRVDLSAATTVYHRFRIRQIVVISYRLLGQKYNT